MADYKVQHVIICEDVRREVNGKEILIGVYNDVIIFKSIPGKLAQLVFRISISCPPKYHGSHEISLVGPDGKALFETAVELPEVKSDDTKRIVAVGVQSVSFPISGTYQVKFGPKAAAKKIWELVVRLPSGDIEARRLAQSEL